MFPANRKNVVSRKTSSKFQKQKTQINKRLHLMPIASEKIRISF